MGISSAGGSYDAYADMVLNQQEYVYKLTQQKVESKKDCSIAEGNLEQKHTDYSIARNVFEKCSDEKATLESNLKKLQEEMNARIKQAQEDALAQGKDDIEINRIIGSIQSQYASKISNLQFNISRVGATNITKYATMSAAESDYRGSRFDNISATNNYLGILSSLFSAQLDLGKMQQNQAFFDSQQGGWLG